MAELSIIVPVYNEAEHILPFYYELKKHTPRDIELIWVNDGSTDSTAAEIEQLINLDARIRCISLTRNFGKIAAVSAGIDFALAPNIIIMSGDLKNPPSVIPKLLAKIEEGYEVVTAISNNHSKVFWGQKHLLNGYYKLLDIIAPDRNNNNITLFRALNAKVSEGIRQVKERNLFLSNFFIWSGYKTATVQYYCAKCGKTDKKYSIANLKKETAIALQQLKPGVYKSLMVAASATMLATIYNLNTIASSGKTSITLVSIISLALFAVSVFLFWKSRVQLSKSRQTENAIKTPKYLIKDVIEQDDNYYEMSYELIKH
ncbi:MAG: glycosyltransferase family 2 protein [Chitinophagaceae bacterium]